MSSVEKRIIRFDPEAVQTEQGRRGFLSGLAMAVGATALAPLILRGKGITELLAMQASEETEPNLTDTDILNYALSLEYLEATFYLRADNNGTLPSGATAATIDPDGNGAPGSVPGLASVTAPAPSTLAVAAFVRTVRDHEITHVLALQTALGAGALARGDFRFDFPGGFTTAAAFLATAQALEDTGVTAYLGQTNNLDSVDYLTTAGTILGVEAEHAATFRVINQTEVTVDNGSFDTGRTTTEVLAIAGAFITASPPLPFPK